MSAGHFNRISLFLPFYAILELPYLHGARNLARREGQLVKPVWTPVAILGSLGVCIFVPASRHWLMSYSLIHLAYPDVIV